MNPHLLYVEDDETLAFVTKDNLELQNYEITHCLDGEEALDTFKKGTFDLCILDVMLPKMDGFELAKHIRKLNSEIPIIFLTAKSLKEDKIHGLKLGGDDYITKPFSIEELILKIEVFLRRSKFSSPLASTIIKIGKYSFDYNNLSLIFDKEGKSLTQREADLLLFLCKKANHVVKRGVILEAIWGEDDYFLGRSLDVFISRLRKYLKKDDSIKLENIHGVGFRLKIVE